MDNVGLVCVSCQKVDCGNGVWLTIENNAVNEQKSSLCPDCCRIRFPQFYSDFKPPAKPRPVLNGMLASIVNFIKT